MSTASTAATRSKTANPATTRHRGEVKTMIKKLQDVFFSRKAVRNDARQFNGQMLDQHREDVYAVMHQQMAGLR